MRVALLLLLAGTAFAHEAKPAPPAHPGAAQTSEDDEQKLAKGDTVVQLNLDGQGGGFVTGVVDIAASEEAIWRILAAFERIPESTPAIKTVDRYRDDKTAWGRHVDVGYMLEIAWEKVHYHVHHDWVPDKRYLVWTLDPDRENDIVDTTGSFSTFPSPRPGHVRFVYRTRVITGRRIPKWVEEELSVQSLKKYIRFIQKEAER